MVTKKTVRMVKVMDNEPTGRLAMVGSEPHAILEGAAAALAFHSEQQQVQMKRRLKKMEAACVKKLQEVHNGYLKAKEKYRESEQARLALEEEIRELEAKYNQKASQMRQLNEKLKLAVNANEALKSGGTRGANVMGQRFPASMGGSGDGGAAHMVTTMRRTQVYATGRAPASSPLGNPIGFQHMHGQRSSGQGMAGGAGGGGGDSFLMEDSPLRLRNGRAMADPSAKPMKSGSASKHGVMHMLDGGHAQGGQLARFSLGGGAPRRQYPGSPGGLSF